MSISPSPLQRSAEQALGRNYTELNIPTHSTGAKIFIAKHQLRAYQDIVNARSKNFSALYIFKQIASLKSVGRLQSLMSKLSVFSHKLPLEGASVQYSIFSGNIYIDKIVLEKVTSTAKGQAAAGVYKASKDNVGRWIVSENEKVAEAGYVNTKHLAINGACDGVADAAKYMPDFIKYGYGEASLANTYSLFFNPCYGDTLGNFRAIRDSLPMGGSSQSAKKLSAVLERIQAKGQSVNLTVNESGHALLKSALRDFTSTSKQLDKVTVFYANPMNNLQAVDGLRKKAGMQLAAKPPLINPLSISQKFTSGNFISASVIAGRAGSNAFSHAYDSAGQTMALAGVASFGAGFYGAGAWALGAAPFVLGQSRSANKRVITSSGESIAHGASHYGAKAKKLVWDPVHRMMVKS